MPLMTFTVLGPPATTMNATDHPLTNGSIVTVQNSGGDLPAPLAIGTLYYVQNAASDTFEFSLTPGGASISLTTAGSGLNEVSYSWLADFSAGHRLLAGDISAILKPVHNWPDNVNAGGFALANLGRLIAAPGKFLNGTGSVLMSDDGAGNWTVLAPDGNTIGAIGTTTQGLQEA